MKNSESKTIWKSNTLANKKLVKRPNKIISNNKKKKPMSQKKNQTIQISESNKKWKKTEKP